MTRRGSSGILVQESPVPPVQDQSLEVVERKGKGHPDTICDAVGERISIELARAYQRQFGRVLHHNVDKSLLVAGQVDCRLGGGRVVEPMRLIIGDRAATGLGRKTIPIGRIAVQAAKAWFRDNLPHVDPERHVRYQVELKPTSAELEALFDPRKGPRGANDTSAAVGYAPLTPTEQLVLGLERFLNGPAFKREFPETGEDVKVMAFRLGRDLSVTVAMPVLASAVSSEADYFGLKGRILRAIRMHLAQRPGGGHAIALRLNALDRRGQGVEGMYLSVLGTSAEQGDSGQIGRGNRVSGVTALTRPMSAEAAAGKNAVSHVGKIYNVLAHELAERIFRAAPGIREVTVWLGTQIGRRIDRPLLAVASIRPARGASFRDLQGPVRDLIQDALDNLHAFSQALAVGQYRMY